MSPPANFPPGTPDPASDALRRGIQAADQGRPLDAARLFVAVLQRQPDSFEAHCRLGMALRDLNQLDDAAQCLETAAKLRPNHPGLHLLLGAVHKRKGNLQAAADCCRRELALDPANAVAWCNLGLTLQAMERTEEARAAYEKALALRPDYVEALVNLAALLEDQRDLEGAAAACERALRCQPHNAEVHWQLANALLSRGDWARGWQEYEWRWKLKDFTTPAGSFRQPRWDGSDPAGRRILLYAEQGFGDTIQFVRYAPLIAQRGGRVIVGCPAAITSLVARVAGVEQVGSNRDTLPPFDAHAPLLSLPALFHTTLASVPAAVPYITPPERRVPIGAPDPGALKAGLVWAGAPNHKNDRRRSMPLEAARPLLDLPNVRWFSLQGAPGSADLARFPWTPAITDLGSHFANFDDTASAVSQLDVVLSVDTAVAHLAGAMAKPVLLLLPYAGEWRWMQHRADSPWYPTMRLLRQTRPGDWAGVIQQAKDLLATRHFAVSSTISR